MDNSSWNLLIAALGLTGLAGLAGSARPVAGSDDIGMGDLNLGSGTCRACSGPLYGAAGSPNPVAADSAAIAQRQRMAQAVRARAAERLRRAMTRGMKAGIYGRRFGEPCCLLVRRKQALALVKQYEAARTVAQRSYAAQGKSASVALILAKVDARRAVGSTLVQTVAIPGASARRRAPPPVRLESLPGVPALLPVMSPDAATPSLLNTIGSTFMVPASPRGANTRLEEELFVTPTERLMGFSAPSLFLRDKQGHQVSVVVFAQDGGVLFFPLVNHVKMFTQTSKMSAPSFSLPAGNIDAGGTCVSAAVRSRDPCQRNICDMCYALGSNYGNLSVVITGVVRLRHVLQQCEADPSGMVLGGELARAVESYARYGRDDGRTHLEIGVWQGTRRGLTRSGRGGIKAYPTVLSAPRRPKRLMQPITAALAKKIRRPDLAPSVITRVVKGRDFAKNKVPGGHLVAASVELKNGRQEVLKAGATGLARFRRLLSADRVKRATCQITVMAGRPNKGKTVRLGATSTATLFRRAPKGSVAGFFRWHDAGDVTISKTPELVDAYMAALIHCAEATPHVYYWMPTRAWRAPSDRLAALLGQANTLPNFAVRPSAIEVDVAAPTVVLAGSASRGVPVHPHKLWRVLARRMGGTTNLQELAARVYADAPADQKLAAGSTVNIKIGKVTTVDGAAVSRGNFSVYVDDERGVACWACPVYSLIVRRQDGTFGEAKSCHAAGCRFCWIARDYPVTYGAH